MVIYNKELNVFCLQVCWRLSNDQLLRFWYAETSLLVEDAISSTVHTLGLKNVCIDFMAYLKFHLTRLIIYIYIEYFLKIYNELNRTIGLGDTNLNVVVIYTLLFRKSLRGRHTLDFQGIL